jgi:hypothetical protein
MMGLRYQKVSQSDGFEDLNFFHFKDAFEGKIGQRWDPGFQAPTHLSI